MHRSISGFKTLAAAALAVATGAASYTAIAQKIGTVTVKATGPTRSMIGGPMWAITVRRVVRYADISLATESGVATLEKRIREAAKSGCAELDYHYPVTIEDDATTKCIESAVNSAMADARKAIDAAKIAPVKN